MVHIMDSWTVPEGPHQGPLHGALFRWFSPWLTMFGSMMSPMVCPTNAHHRTLSDFCSLFSVPPMQMLPPVVFCHIFLFLFFLFFLSCYLLFSVNSLLASICCAFRIQHVGIAVSSFLIYEYYFLRYICLVVYDDKACISLRRVKHQHGHWVCWMSMGGTNRHNVKIIHTALHSSSFACNVRCYTPHY